VAVFGFRFGGSGRCHRREIPSDKVGTFVAALGMTMLVHEGRL
jgi:hypothetical protein